MLLLKPLLGEPRVIPAEPEIVGHQTTGVRGISENGGAGASVGPLNPQQRHIVIDWPVRVGNEGDRALGSVAPPIDGEAGPAASEGQPGRPKIGHASPITATILSINSWV